MSDTPILANAIEEPFYAGVGVADIFTNKDPLKINIVSYQNDTATVGVKVKLAGTIATFPVFGEADDDTFDVSISGLIGTNYNDWLAGNSAANTLNGGAGDDVLHGLGGGDLLIGGAHGQTGDKVSYEYLELPPDTTDGVVVNLSNTGPITTGGAAAGDVYQSIEGVIGSKYNDTLFGGLAVNSLEGGAGDDYLISGAGADRFYGTVVRDTGAVEFDTVSYEFAASAIITDMTYGGERAGEAIGDTYANIERLIGSAFSDQLGGNMYSNTLAGGAGSDRLWGYNGADKLEGGEGTDWACYELNSAAVEVNLETGTGTGGQAAGDTFVDIEAVLGTQNNDTFIGNAFANIFDGRTGADSMTGADGNDIYYVQDAGDVVTETNADAVTGGVDLVYSSVSHALSAYVENLMAIGSGSIRLYGNSLANTITGNAGANVISAGSGNDKINGGYGKDTLYGGAGKDIFQFTTKASSTNIDKIADYSVSYDSIQLDNKYFTKLGSGSATSPKMLASSAFYKGLKAHDSNDRLIYDASKGYLYYDADGTGSSKQVLIATFANKAALKYSEFYVI